MSASQNYPAQQVAVFFIKPDDMLLAVEAFQMGGDKVAEIFQVDKKFMVVVWMMRDSKWQTNDWRERFEK